jgi:hypothetical protein
MNIRNKKKCIVYVVICKLLTAFLFSFQPSLGLAKINQEFIKDLSLKLGNRQEICQLIFEVDSEECLKLVMQKTYLEAVNSRQGFAADLLRQSYADIKQVFFDYTRGGLIFANMTRENLYKHFEAVLNEFLFSLDPQGQAHTLMGKVLQKKAALTNCRLD